MKEILMKFLSQHFERLVFMFLGTGYSGALVWYGIKMSDDTVKGIGIGFFTAVVGLFINKMRTPKDIQEQDPK